MVTRILFVFCLCSPWCHATTAFINKIPDITQTQVKGSKTGNGRQYCAPVAVANSLAWMSGRTPQSMAMIRKLGSSQYMNTSLKNGTGTSGVLRGVNKLALEIFGGYKILEYEGWRKHPASYSTGIKLPNLKRLKSAVSEKSAAWLNIGWYRFNKSNREYLRIGGHWVTLVGSNHRQLILHDPAPRAGKSFANEYVTYHQIQAGTLVGNKQGLPRPARGYLQLGEGMHIKSKADVAIIDGVVYFEL